MTPATVLAIALLCGTTDPLTARIADANAAAQALQGVFDGGWTLRDASGAILYRLQLTDPPNGDGPVVGAWRDPKGGMGAIKIERVARDRIDLFIETERTFRLALVRVRGAWRGAMAGRAVTLSRSLATGGPAV